MPLYSSIYDGPPNSYGGTKTTKRWIVIHNTSNDAPAVNEASYAKRRTDSVSSHYYVDDERIIQSLNTDYRAFHVGSTTGNSGGISYEITGTNAKSRSWWLDNVAWVLLAAQIRKDCAAHGITPRLLSIEQIRAGTTGIMTHDQARRAWGGTDHTDPGPNFPLDHLLEQVTEDDDMELTDKLTLTAWTKEHWDIGDTTVGGALREMYAYSRAGSDRAVEILTAVNATKLQGEAILGAVKGLDTKAVIAAVNTAAAADAQRDAQLLAELQSLADGGATAQDILDALAARLATPTE